MSQQPPPPPGPYGGPPPGAPGGPPPRRRRRRPHGAWFALPVTLGVVAGALVVTAILTTFGALAESDGVVSADGSAQTVELSDDGSRLLMAPEGEPPPTCEATGADGEPVEVRSPNASYTFGDGSGSWAGFGVVDPGGDSLELTCEASASDGTEVRVGPSPSEGVFAGFAILLISGVGLGFAAFASLVLLVILFATGAPRMGPGS